MLTLIFLSHRDHRDRGSYRCVSHFSLCSCQWGTQQLHIQMSTEAKSCNPLLHASVFHPGCRMKMESAGLDQWNREMPAHTLWGWVVWERSYAVFPHYITPPGASSRKKIKNPLFHHTYSSSRRASMCLYQNHTLLLLKLPTLCLLFYHSNALVPAITFSLMMYCLSLSPRGFDLPSFLSLIAATLLHHILHSLVTLQPCFNQTELMICVTQHNYVIPMELATEKTDMSTKRVSAT